MQTVLQFLDRHWDGVSPLLLGLSGGPDSLALLYWLRQGNIPLHLAHVDHGWRHESAQEAQQLVALAKELSLPIHTKRLEAEAKGNREATCRNERLAFFRHLVKEFGCQAVLLAHHADDLAETALKRVLEGASLPCLGGMREVSEIDGLPIWRPLLKTSKQEILLFIEERRLLPFDDETNRDERYMRARLRHRIIPDLAEIFGKEIRRGLCTIAEEANELRDYLEFRTQPWLQRFESTPEGLRVDLNGHELHDLELRFVVRRFCELAGLGTSRQLTQRVIELLRKGVIHKRVEQGSRSIVVDRGRLYG